MLFISGIVYYKKKYALSDTFSITDISLISSSCSEHMVKNICNYGQQIVGFWCNKGRWGHQLGENLCIFCHWPHLAAAAPGWSSSRSNYPHPPRPPPWVSPGSVWHTWKCRYRICPRHSWWIWRPQKWWSPSGPEPSDPWSTGCFPLETN